MSEFIAPNYNYAPEISASFDQGFLDASAVHRATPANIGDVDVNGWEVGYSVGYREARDYHKTAVVTGADLSGQSRAYLDGYSAASTFHSTNTITGDDLLSVERGYAEGYKASRDYHTTNTVTGTDATGLLRGYAEGYQNSSAFHTAAATLTNPANDASGVDRGYNTGYNVGTAAETRPHIVCGLGANFVATTGDAIYTLPCSTTLSSKDVTNSNGTITINSAGTWEFYMLFSWAFTVNHWAQNTIFTRATIHEETGGALGTIRGRGVTRRRNSDDWFGSTGAYWRGTVSAGDAFTARVEYDWNDSDEMTVYKEATDIDTLSVPSQATNKGGYTEIFGPACRFVAIKQG